MKAILYVGAALVGGALAQTANAQETYHQIQGVGNLCIQVWASHPSYGIKLNQCGVARNNLWKVGADGYVTDTYGRCLRVHPQASPGDSVTVDDCAPAPYSRWKFERDHFIGKDNLCLQAQGGAGIGNYVIVNRCDPAADVSPNNTWRLITPTTTIP